MLFHDYVKIYYDIEHDRFLPIDFKTFILNDKLWAKRCDQMM